MNNSAKKQNRILLVTLVVILAAIATLIAIAGTARKKEISEKVPPLETEAESETQDAVLTPARKETPAAPETESAPEETEKPQTASVDEEETAPVSVSDEDVLPTFAAPVDGLVIKECSLTVPVYSDTMQDYRVHRGLDFACSPGTPVYASASGVICELQNDPMMGVTVGIRHNGGAVTRYQGLDVDSLSMNELGLAVEAGQLIGASGETALIESAEEPHLHFELLVNGQAEDPAEYFAVTTLASLVED